MDRILSKKKVNDYLKSLAELSNDIQLFVGTSELELDAAINKKSGLLSPCLNFYGYSWKLSGNHQRTFNTRTISFAVLIAGVKNDDFEARDNAITRAEEIGLDVLSRIYQDSLKPEFEWLYNNVDKSSVEGYEIKAKKPEGLYGMEFHVDIKVHEPLVVDPAKWSDGDSFCN
ncbi:hypothetical protein [Flavobacterium beibuense]|uniref:hypothetical protein n=1 Tax=Flavobacterium beibuense TaxID=657326 RepID=UPI003A909BA7